MTVVIWAAIKTFASFIFRKVFYRVFVFIRDKLYKKELNKPGLVEQGFSDC